MAHPLHKRLAPFRTASSASSPAGTGGPDAAVAVLAAWMEPRHTLLLRTLLDRTPGVRLDPAPAVARGVDRILDTLRRETRLKYAEFRERWEARLAPQALLPFLRRNQWIVPHSDGGLTLAGKGGRKEARMLYLQTGHDMATDCARQWASVAGRLQAFQASIAAEWHAACVAAGDDATRLLPALEAALRDAELDVWKKMRLSLGEVAEEAFVRAALRWETRSHADEPALVRGVLSGWERHSVSGNGFDGLMRALSHAAERLTLAMLEHYEHKWALYLRGLPSAPAAPAETETRSTP